MHRTEGTNHNGNMFTDGPPGTTVEQNWLNAVQEEIAYVIEQSGGTLKTAAAETSTQLKTALDILYEPIGAIGALVYRSSNQTITTATNTDILWNAEEYDTSSIHSLTLNTDRLTVPASTTRVKLCGQIIFDVGAVGVRSVELFKNGGSSYAGFAQRYWDATVSSDYCKVSFFTPVLQVTGGDYFVVKVYHSQGADLDILGNVDGKNSWFAMEVIE